MPAAIPLVAMGVGLVGNVMASKSQAKAAKQASDVQVNASHEAMDYQRQQQERAMQYAEQMRTQPLQGLQGNTQNYLQKMMGIPSSGGYVGSGGAPFAGAPPMGSTAGYQMKPPAPSMGVGVRQPMGGSYQAMMGQPGQSAGNMVTLEAPNGERQSVPKDQAQGFIAKGARRVS